MPNWCSTIITFCSDNKKDLRRFYDFVANVTNNGPSDTSGFGSSWLGNYLEEVGLNYTKYECRGSVAYLDEEINEENNSFVLQTDTAWAPMMSMWQAILDELKINSIQIFYTAYETGCCIYYTNDPNQLPYFYDICTSLHDDKYKDTIFAYEGIGEATEEDIRENLLVMFPDDAELTTEELVAKFNEEDVGNIYHYEYVPINEL